MRNPVLAVQQKPQWAALTRIAGDRAAILFEELRAAVGRIEGLREDLVHDPSHAGGGTASAWTPRYQVGDRELFRACLTPGRLDVLLELDDISREKLLSASRVSATIKRALCDAQAGPAGRAIRLRLTTRAQVRAFAGAAILLSKASSTRT